jgi:AcrR family transcriptional regulator
MAVKHEKTAVRQKQIVEAAGKVIVKYGSEHITVKRIAKEVGISEAAIYHHFKSKKEILFLMASYVEDKLLGDIAAKSGDSSHTPLEILESALRTHLSAVEQRHGVSFQVIAEIISLGDKKLNRKMADTINKYTSRLKELLSQGVKAGEVREDIDLEAAATLLFSMMQGLVNIWTLSNHSFDLEAKYMPLWDTFRQAVAKRQTPGPSQIPEGMPVVNEL